MPLILDIATIAVSLAAICTSLVVAVRARRFRKQTKVDAARAIRISREQRITQHMENSGGCARLVSIGEQGCGLALPANSSRPTRTVQVNAWARPDEIGAEVAQALRRQRRGEAGS